MFYVVVVVLFFYLLVVVVWVGGMVFVYFCLCLVLFDLLL